MPKSVRVYPTKVDPLIIILVVLVFAAPVVGLLLSHIRPEQTRNVALAAIGVSFLLSFFVMWPVRYTLSDTELKVQCGIVRRTVPLEAILEVQPQRIEGMTLKVFKAAYSMDRLMINTGDWYISISPPDKFEFMADLRSREPALEHSGEGLRRKLS